MRAAGVGCPVPSVVPLCFPGSQLADFLLDAHSLVVSGAPCPAAATTVLCWVLLFPFCYKKSIVLLFVPPVFTHMH